MQKLACGGEAILETFYVVYQVHIGVVVGRK
jgi:hypothetical protein